MDKDARDSIERIINGLSEEAMGLAENDLPNDHIINAIEVIKQVMLKPAQSKERKYTYTKWPSPIDW